MLKLIEGGVIASGYIRVMYFLIDVALFFAWRTFLSNSFYLITFSCQLGAALVKNNMGTDFHSIILRGYILFKNFIRKLSCVVDWNRIKIELLIVFVVIIISVRIIT